MEDFMNLVVIMIGIFGWYVLIKDVLDNYMYRNIEIGDNVKLQIKVKNKEENIEMIIRKIMHAQNKNGYFKEIEIIDENSSDETYEILKKIEKQYSNIKVEKML